MKDRPTIRRFREVLHKTGGNVSKTAAVFKVNRGTLYNWMKEDEAYMQALKDERGALVDECLVSARVLALGIPERDDKGNFVGWIERPDGYMLRYILSTLGKEEGFVESMDITTNGAGRLYAKNIERRCREQGNTFTRISTFTQTQNKQVRIYSNANAVNNVVLMPVGWQRKWPAYSVAMTSFLKEGRNAHDDAPDCTTSVIERMGAGQQTRPDRVFLLRQVVGCFFGNANKYNGFRSLQPTTLQP
ncbi:MAG: phage terminase large subunit [Bacteroidales bacterium]|nr:phage terminase large subunit [Bacteroidales bacterium]